MPEALETKEAKSTLAHDCAFLRAYGEYLYTGKEPRPFINSARAIKEVVERSAALIESQAAEIERLKAVNPVRVAKPVIIEGEGQADDIGRTGSDDSPDRDAILEARRKALRQAANEALAALTNAPMNFSNEAGSEAVSLKSDHLTSPPSQKE